MTDSYRQRSLRVMPLLLVVLTLAACGAPNGAGKDAASASTASSSPSSGAATSPSTRRSATVGSSPTRQVAATTSPDTAADATALPLIVTPTAGPAGTVFEITGTGLPRNAALHAIARSSDWLVVLSRPVTVGADGTLTLRYNSLGEAPSSYTVAIASNLVAATEGNALARGAFTLTEGGPAPTLTLDPDHGPCNVSDPHILARGRNFPPGKYVSLVVLPLDQVSFEGARGTVAADGTFAWPVRLASDHPLPNLGCGPTAPDGTQFHINAVRLQGNVDPRRGELASATFTVSTSAPPLPVLPTQPVEQR